jgi:putative intracellular protease/amidase
MSKRKLAVGVVLFPGFELLDVFGPLELFGISGMFDIATLGVDSGVVKSSYGPCLTVDYGMMEVPELDLLLIPGGDGTRTVVHDPVFMEQLSEVVGKTPYIASVCTGSPLLAKLGVLDGLKATSNKRAFSFAESISKKVIWQRKARWVEAGRFFTSSGVSAGMDMSLAIIEKLCGRDIALNAAKAAEYIWNEDPDVDPFAV